MSGGHLSKEFFELVKSIGESRSKQEEDKIIVNEIATLKHNLQQPQITPKKMKEYMIRAVYVEMLGHDASFAYIHAVKLTHEKTLLAKRVGYLTCNLFLHKDHELMLLLINTMQRDLNSPNHLEVCAALTSVCRLVNVEMIPAISPLVFKLLSHSQDVVRKKAIVAVHRFYKLVPDTVLDQKDMIRKVLCDPDPSVMGASLHILYEIVKTNPASCKDLVPSFVSILKQITEHRLPREFDYHRMPAPWLQVKLLSILGQLGTADQKASEQMYEILQECMRRADSGVNVGYAIIYECVKCITRIYPDHNLLEQAASNISRFISSDNHNLKYLGVTGLAQIVQVNASYAAEHQMVVVDCLEDPDDTLKRKTLDLLFRMTNPQNVVVVVEKLTFHLRTSVDVHLRRELVQKITQLAERFAPNNEWYVSTMNNVFELGGDLVPADTAYNLMRLVAEGTGEDDAADQLFRTFAVNTYLKLLEKTSLSDVLVQVIAWVLGEYAKLASLDGYSLEDIVDLLCETVDRPFEDNSTRGYIVSALMKLTGQNALHSNAVDGVIKSYRSSRLTDLQQRCYEFEQLRQSPGLMRKVLPFDASCEDIIINKDGDLPFLDSFVKAKLDMGAKPYQDFSQRSAMKEAGNGMPVPDLKSKGLNFEAYQAPSKPTPFASSPMPDTPNVETPSAPDPASTGLKVTGPRKWGPASKEPEAPKETPVDKPPEPTPTAPTPSKPVTKSTPAEPPELTEKQKMAAALFSGLGPTKATPAKPTFGGGMTVGTSAPPAATPTPAPKPKPAEPSQPPPPAPVGGTMDLLDLDDFGSSPAPAAAKSAPPPPPAKPSGPGDDMLLLDMGGDTGTDLLGPPTTVTAPAPVAPFLTPLPVTTQQVGGAWGQLAIEKKMQIQTSISSCQEMMHRLQSSLNVHPVEIIGMEGIAAGRVIASPGQDPVFLHGKLAPPALTLLVKCQNPGVGDKVVEICKSVLV
mmetsp:Transcript_87521/g.137026  ORF Transcript_87521/g.137026 Transcript_87521/m.137026 type:complete len:970 (+) Transcript_87521:186-3095(+)